MSNYYVYVNNLNNFNSSSNYSYNNNFTEETSKNLTSNPAPVNSLEGIPNPATILQLSNMDNTNSDKTFEFQTKYYQSHYPIIPQCCHMRLTLKLEIDNCRSYLCISCIFLGILGVIVFLLALLKSSDNKSSNNSEDYTIRHSDESYHSHWLFVYGGYDQEFYEKRNVYLHDGDSGAESGCCGLVYPHKYQIICLECKQKLKEGTKYGSFYTAIFFGLFGIVIGLFGIYLIIF